MFFCLHFLNFSVQSYLVQNESMRHPGRENPGLSLPTRQPVKFLTSSVFCNHATRDRNCKYVIRVIGWRLLLRLREPRPISPTFGSAHATSALSPPCSGTPESPDCHPIRRTSPGFLPILANSQFTRLNLLLNSVL